MKNLVVKKAMVRVLLDPEERKRRADASKRRWNLANYEYNLMQKRALGARPAYLALRRQRYHSRKPSHVRTRVRLSNENPTPT
jgi:hypothetical protein